MNRLAASQPDRPDLLEAGAAGRGGNDPTLRDLLPQIPPVFDEIPEELLRRLFSVFRLQIRYNAQHRTAMIRASRASWSTRRKSSVKPGRLPDHTGHDLGRGGQVGRTATERHDMALVLIVLLLALLLGGLGFAVHLLWWVALIVLVLWLLGFVLRGTGAGGTRGRWYRW